MFGNSNSTRLADGNWCIPVSNKSQALEEQRNRDARACIDNACKLKYVNGFTDDRKSINELPDYLL